MTKYVYVGDPKGKPHSSGECVLVEGTSKERFIFTVGEAREVPAWVEECVKANSHFKRVEDEPNALAVLEQAAAAKPENYKSKPLSLGDKPK